MTNAWSPSACVEDRQSAQEDRRRADRLLAEVQRLYRELQALPGCEQTRPPSLARIAIEVKIRWYADQYKNATEVPDDLLARRVNPDPLIAETPRRPDSLIVDPVNPQTVLRGLKWPA